MKMSSFLQYLALLALLIMDSKANAQTFCFTPPSSSNENLYSSSLKSASVDASYCLRIYVHVIRKSNKSGGQSIQDVNTALSFLDIDFNPHGIFFKWDGSIDYIDNDTYYGTPTTSIYTVNNHNDGIDIYLYDDKSGAGGRANGVGESSEFWVSGSFWKEPYGSLVKSHVISHEMGHVIFLWHTHHGTYNEGGNDSPCAELVNGSNSTTCGDHISDTPADPHLQFDVNYSNCTWNSSGKDANGDSYNPDETLIMSYSHPNCMSYFSQQQGLRMRNAIATLTHLKNAVVSCGTSCPSDLNITQNVSSGNTDNQKADVSLTASNIIENNATANYSAGTKIVLKPGFHAKNGSNFNASIKTCTTNGLKSAKLTAEQGESTNSLKIRNDKVSTFSVYPNPARTEITVSCHFENSVGLKVIVYNTFGNLLKSVSIINANTPINISEIPNGLYILKVCDSNSEIWIQKLLIQR